ncbi:sensor histidine kinase [Aristaeella lactis]|uniref:Histidine kinase-, DNA gyrase B-, and HSP90-like ATPase n=1 Tax=Aristaeella lactis TaxID=3046383 RepID=A0AC61PQN9_9FIRM|nr:HAMP domain-containing sensor histidine kinase [Aristaeella lactis]QUA52393.1 HAMP domain-containing histidine kinase [Aristaeella lactis]SMC92844.1 Histidine kinase-, DNA gyrase B-, and HSP90-like ATPase [Aristaeella lactis]
MALSILILAISAVLLLVFSLRSRYGLPLFLMNAGISIACVAVMFQTSSTSMYTTPRIFPLRSLDQALFQLISRMRLPLSQAQTLRNCGTLVFFFGIVLMLMLIARNIKTIHHRIFWEVLCGTAVFLFLTAYMVFFSPACAFRLYMRYYELSGAARASFVQLITLITRLFKGLILLFVLSPALLLTVQYIRKNVTCFNDTFFLLLGISSLYGFVFFIVFHTIPLALSSQAVFLSAFWFFANGTWLPGWITLFFLLFSLLTLILILASANRIFSGDLVLLSRKRAMKNSIEDLNRNLKDVFHSEKNLMFSILILANEARDAYGTPEGLEKLDRLTEISKDRMEMITSSLNRIRELHLHATPTDMRTLVSQALDNLTLPEGIRIEKHFCNEAVLCMVDEYHTRNALKNIFVNAVDALQLTGREDKVLSVSVEASKAWVSLSIRDNGPGIPKQELRRVMMPFVSTKSKTSNWGIGLPYAFRVVNAQLGQMRIRSSDQAGRSYTQVDILLPRERIDV